MPTCAPPPDLISDWRDFMRFAPQSSLPGEALFKMRCHMSVMRCSAR